MNTLLTQDYINKLTNLTEHRYKDSEKSHKRIAYNDLVKDLIEELNEKYDLKRYLNEF